MITKLKQKNSKSSFSCDIYFIIIYNYQDQIKYKKIN